MGNFTLYQSVKIFELFVKHIKTEFKNISAVSSSNICNCLEQSYFNFDQVFDIIDKTYYRNKKIIELTVKLIIKLTNMLIKTIEKQTDKHHENVPIFQTPEVKISTFIKSPTH